MFAFQKIIYQLKKKEGRKSYKLILTNHFKRHILRQEHVLLLYLSEDLKRAVNSKTMPYVL